MMTIKQSMHKGAVACREEGLKGLWKGIGPNVARNAIVNAAELASYDQVLCSLSTCSKLKAQAGAAQACFLLCTQWNYVTCESASTSNNSSYRSASQCQAPTRHVPTSASTTIELFISVPSSPVGTDPDIGVFTCLHVKPANVLLQIIGLA